MAPWCLRPSNMLMKSSLLMTAARITPQKLPGLPEQLWCATLETKVMVLPSRVFLPRQRRETLTFWCCLMLMLSTIPRRYLTWSGPFGKGLILLLAPGRSRRVTFLGIAGLVKKCFCIQPISSHGRSSLIPNLVSGHFLRKR